MTTARESLNAKLAGVLSADECVALEHVRQMMRRDRPAGEVDADRYKRFYRSRAWRAARYEFLRKQPRPLRCACCGATTADSRLAVDHIVPIKKDWDRRLDQANFQLLCAGTTGGLACNLAKGSHDETDWREPHRRGAL